MYADSKLYIFSPRNPDVETIELKLLEALVKIGSVQETHMKYYLDDNVNQVRFLYIIFFLLLLLNIFIKSFFLSSVIKFWSWWHQHIN